MLTIGVIDMNPLTYKLSVWADHQTPMCYYRDLDIMFFIVYTKIIFKVD